jgi:hypothetical protein
LGILPVWEMRKRRRRRRTESKTCYSVKEESDQTLAPQEMQTITPVRDAKGKHTLSKQTPRDYYNMWSGQHNYFCCHDCDMRE